MTKGNRSLIRLSNLNRRKWEGEKEEKGKKKKRKKKKELKWETTKKIRQGGGSAWRIFFFLKKKKKEKVRPKSPNDVAEYTRRDSAEMDQVRSISLGQIHAMLC